jgi:hypothetical protein
VQALDQYEPAHIKAEVSFYFMNWLILLEPQDLMMVIKLRISREETMRWFAKSAIRP